MTGWLLRPVVWFATASMVTTVLHELTHALVAYALGVRSTLHNYFVDLDLTPDQAATNIPAIIGVAGPSFCLALGVAAWFAYRYVGRGFTPRQARGGLSQSKASRAEPGRSAAELPLLFFAVFGIGTFFGNLVSASFIGDFSRAAVALHLPMPARYTVSVVGAVGTAAVHFMAGRELTRWMPPTIGRVAGMLGIIAVPVIVGMAIVILANLPAAIAGVRAAEAAFWIFAAIGVLVPSAGPPPDGAAKTTPYVRWVDAAALLVAILIVRVLVRGIPFVP